MPGLACREALFARAAAGAVGLIHLNGLGAYLIAATHFAVFYHQSPEGPPAILLRAGLLRAGLLRAGLLRADEQPATPLPSAAIAPLQRLVWQVVTRYALTGVGRN